MSNVNKEGVPGFNDRALATQTHMDLCEAPCVQTKTASFYCLFSFLMAVGDSETKTHLFGNIQRMVLMGPFLEVSLHHHYARFCCLCCRSVGNSTIASRWKQINSRKRKPHLLPPFFPNHIASPPPGQVVVGKYTQGRWELLLMRISLQFYFPIWSS